MPFLSVLEEIPNRKKYTEIFVQVYDTEEKADYRLTLVQSTLAPLTAAALRLVHQTALISGVRLGWLLNLRNFFFPAGGLSAFRVLLCVCKLGAFGFMEEVIITNAAKTTPSPA